MKRQRGGRNFQPQKISVLIKQALKELEPKTKEFPHVNFGLCKAGTIKIGLN